MKRMLLLAVLLLAALPEVNAGSNAVANASSVTNQAALDRQKRAAYKIMTDRMAVIRRQVAASGRVVLGAVSQKTKIGLMVQSGQVLRNNPNYGNSTARLIASRFPRGSEFYGLCLLLDHPNYMKLVDDDYLEIVAYPYGEYSYASVGAGAKTIRRFTADFNKAYSGALKEAGFVAPKK